MTAARKIQEALEQIMSGAEARACRVYKGYAYDGAYAGNGWWFEPFGQNPRYLGANLAEALETINQIVAERQ
jgi:hypothetical protein